jgi:hypothetical protein
MTEQIQQLHYILIHKLQLQELVMLMLYLGIIQIIQDLIFQDMLLFTQQLQTMEVQLVLWMILKFMKQP